MADCFTEERFQLLRALGAEVDVIPSVEGRPKVTAQDIRNMVARAAELASGRATTRTDQFNNPYIVPGHRDRLGREIWEQTEGRVTAFCQGMGTASSLLGVSRGAPAARRLHPGARAGLVGRDRGRRRQRRVRDAGLGRLRHAALGPGPRSTMSSRSATTRRSR